MSSPRLLTVDLGNSSAKLRLWSADGPAPNEPLARARLAAGAELAATATEWVGAVGGASAAAVASVGDPVLTRGLVERLGALLSGRVAAPPDPGLTLEVEHPETLGEDRVFAARGAVEAVGARAIVVDVGTALTVDAVGWTPAGGVFLGGAIAPGPAGLARALAREGRRLPEIEPAPGAPALGRDTAGAMRAGVAVGLRGAARALVLEQAADPAFARYGAGGAPPTVVVAGGGAAFLLEPGPFCDLPLVTLPEAVHHGLWYAAREWSR